MGVNLSFLPQCVQHLSSSRAFVPDDCYAYVAETVADCPSNVGGFGQIDLPPHVWDIPGGLLRLNYKLLAGTSSSIVHLPETSLEQLVSPLCEFSVSAKERSNLTVGFSRGSADIHLVILPGLTRIKIYPTFDAGFLSYVSPQGERVLMTVTMALSARPQETISASQEFRVLPASIVSEPPSAKFLMPMIYDYTPAIKEILPGSADRSPDKLEIAEYGHWLVSIPPANGWSMTEHYKVPYLTIRTPTLALSEGNMSSAEVIAILSTLAISDGWNAWLLELGDDGVVLAINKGSSPIPQNQSTVYINIAHLVSGNGDVLVSGINASLLSKQPYPVNVNSAVQYYVPDPPSKAKEASHLGDTAKTIDEVFATHPK